VEGEDERGDAMKFPKPKSSKGQRTKRHQAKMLSFINAVWLREGILDYGHMTRCRKCSCWVYRHDGSGEVHHLKPRSTSPESKYDPTNGVILCRECHRAVTEHRITL
jgi:5-methylcytosine-specific restriction endonuclease McrA